MIWKTILIAFLAVGAYAELQINEAQRQKIREYLTDACKKNGAEDQVDNVAKAAHSFVDCLKELFNPEQIKKEIEEAKPNGALDEVFKKYCEKTPQLKTCLHNMLSGVSPCLDANSRSHINDAKNGTDNFIDFICYKDGDRIALFIAEGGPECFQEKANDIKACADKLKETVPSMDAAKALTLQDKCNKFDELTSCVVKALESCTQPTPANMAESLFKYVRNSSPCANKKA